MLDEEAKRAILGRRARFLAAAVATVGIASGCEKRDVRPEPCLSMIADPVDAAGAADAAVPDDAAKTTTSPEPSQKPMVCLSELPH